MNATTSTIICAALDADKSVTTERRNIAIAILNGTVPQHLSDVVGRSFSQTTTVNKTIPNTAAPEKAYLRRREAAKYLGCCVRQIDQFKHDGSLPFCRLGRRLIVFRLVDLDKLMSNRRIDAAG
jgi:excisionase family DNA binding protein